MQCDQNKDLEIGRADGGVERGGRMEGRCSLRRVRVLSDLMYRLTMLRSADSHGHIHSMASSFFLLLSTVRYAFGSVHPLIRTNMP